MFIENCNAKLCSHALHRNTKEKFPVANNGNHCRMRRHRRLHEPEVLGRSDDESEEEMQRPMRKVEADESSEEEEEELDEEVRKLRLLRNV